MAKIDVAREGELPSVHLFCQAEPQEQQETTVTPAAATGAESELVKGTRVLWECMGRDIPGTIKSVNVDGTYVIKWTHGSIVIVDWMRRGIESSKRVDEGRIKPPPDTSKWLKKLLAGDKDLQGADFRFLKLTRIDFLGCDLTGAKFDGCKLVHCSFGCWDPKTGKHDLSRRGSLPKLDGATFWCATLTDVDFTFNALKGVQFGEQLCGAILIRVNFAVATMNDVKPVSYTHLTLPTILLV